MSTDVPVVTVAFGGVTPPQEDILELRVHLGCTKEVSSFDCLLQNFDKKYTVTNPINVSDNGSISIGRETNCPLILTGRVEEIQPESTPIENYIRVRGRCWGEKIFRRVVTKTYENQKGEAIVKDLLDNYVGLSHSRTSNLIQNAAAGQPECVVADGTKFRAGDKVQISDDSNSEWNEVSSVSTNTVTMVNNLSNTYTVSANGKVTSELVEDTDTTYTLLEYENTPVFDILKYIGESADKAGVIGYDLRIEYDGKFRFFPKNTRPSPISLSETIEASRCSKDIHRIRNKITVYGAAEKANPSDKDTWTETLDVNNDETNDWTSGTGTGSVSLDNTEKIVGSYSIKHTTSTPDYYGCAILTFPSDMEVDCNKYPSLTFQIKLESAFNGNVGLGLEDSVGMKVRREIGVAASNKWILQGFGVGKKHTDEWTHSVFNSQPFNWDDVKKILFYCNFSGTGTGSFWIDNLFFNRCRWEATQEDATSQSSYGLRELVEVDEELHSDNECDLRAKALLDHLSDPAEFLTLQTTCLDYSTNRLLPGDKIHVTLPNENIDSDFRIISVEYRVLAREQTLEITLELGKEKPLLADYLYGLRATTVTVEKLMRTKASLTGVAGSAGGGGGGCGGTGTDEKVKVTSNDTVAEYLSDKFVEGTGITLTEQNDGGDESLKIDAHRKWWILEEWTWKNHFILPYAVEWNKYASNPIFTKSGVSGKFDEYHVAGNCIIYIDGYFYLFYHGNRPSEGIGVARSTSIIGPYTRLNSGNPIIPTDAGWLDEVAYPTVIYDEWEIDANKRWKMWFATLDGSTRYIGYSYCATPDGAWNTPASITLPYTMTGWGKWFTKLGNLYYAVYPGTNQELYAMYSKDPDANWIGLGKKVSLGSAGAWDDTYLGYLGGTYIQGILYLLYSGCTGGWTTYKIGMAGAGFEKMWKNGVEFDKFPANPILDKSASGWDDKIVQCPNFLQVEDNLYMVYMAQSTQLSSDGKEERAIGLASIPC